MSKQTKTYKREIAFGMILWLMYLSVYGDKDVLEILVWPVFTFVLAAFSLDSVAKQLQQDSLFGPRGRTQRSSERTGRED